MYVDLSNLPSPPQKKQVVLGGLYGGLNTRDLPSEIKSNQCSELVNMIWKDGALRSRGGQEMLPNTNNWKPEEEYNGIEPIVLYDRVWHDRLIFAALGTQKSFYIVAYDLRSNEYETIYENYDVINEYRYGSNGTDGCFFEFGERLYYKNRGIYVAIGYLPQEEDDPKDYVFSENVIGYIPVIQINTNSEGVGDLYQPENRLSEWKEVWYTLDTGVVYEEFACDGSTTVFQLQHKQNEQLQDGDLRAVLEVYIGAKLGIQGEDYEVNLKSGTITILGEAPAIGLKLRAKLQLYKFSYKLPVDEIDRTDGIPELRVWVKNLESGEYVPYSYNANDPEEMEFGYSNGFVVFDSDTILGGDNAPNFDANVRSRFIKIQYAKKNDVARTAIEECHIATSFGASGIETNCIVFAGYKEQENAVFWSGNDENGANPAYFPMEQYNIIGVEDDPITAFGRQQNKLVILQKRRTSSATFSLDTVDGRTVVSLPIKTINDKIGCDVPGSVQLIENNLVWANRKLGVMYLKDSTYAYETLIVGISGNINEDSKVTGQDGLNTLLIKGVRVCSFDDGSRYWLCSDGKAFIWDYGLQGYSSNTDKLCWFYAEGIEVIGWAQNGDDVYGVRNERDGSWIFENTDEYLDYNEPFAKVVRLQTQTFGTMHMAKNVEDIVFTMDSRNEVHAKIEYITDYEKRMDLTPIDSNFETTLSEPMNPICVRIRKPKCRRIHHFTVRLSNKEVSDLNLIAVQILYTTNDGLIKAGRRM